MCTGVQPDGCCIVNDTIFISPDGDLINSEDSPYILLDKDFTVTVIKLSLQMSPIIPVPLSINPLAELIITLEDICKYIFLPAITVVAGGIMTFHYTTIKD